MAVYRCGFRRGYEKAEQTRHDIMVLRQSTDPFLPLRPFLYVRCTYFIPDTMSLFTCFEPDKRGLTASAAGFTPINAAYFCQIQQPERRDKGQCSSLPPGGLAAVRKGTLNDSRHIQWLKCLGKTPSQGCEAYTQASHPCLSPPYFFDCSHQNTDF